MAAQSYKRAFVVLAAVATSTSHCHVPILPGPRQTTPAESLILRYSRATSELSLDLQKRAAAQFEAALQKVDKADPFCLKAWYDLGTDYWRLADYPRAALAFQIAIGHKGMALDERFGWVPHAAISQYAMVLADMHAPLSKRLAAWRHFETTHDEDGLVTASDYFQSKTAIIAMLLDENTPKDNAQALSEIRAFVALGKSGKLVEVQKPNVKVVGPIVKLDWRENARAYLRNLIRTAAEIRDLTNARAAYLFDHREFGQGDEEIALRGDLLRADKGKLNAADYSDLLAEFPKPVLPRADVLADALDEAFAREDCRLVVKYGDELLAMPSVPDSDEDPARHHPFARQAIEACRKAKGHTTKIVPASSRASTMDMGVSGLLVVGCGYGLIKLLSQLRPGSKNT